MTTFANGREAEQAAADYISKQGFRIIARNWRTPWAEIDIIASKKNVVYFCEVKYRQNPLQGGGLDYITPAKLRQMGRAAESWMSLTNWSGESQLAAIEVSGTDFRITAFIDAITT